MATKLKKRKPVLTFIIFFIAMNLLLLSLMGGLWLVGNNGVPYIGMDYKLTSAYQNQMYGGYIIDGLYDAMHPETTTTFTVKQDASILEENGTMPESSVAHSSSDFLYHAEGLSEGIAREGENILWMIQYADGTVVSSTDQAQTPDEFYEMISSEMDGARNYYNPMAIVPTYVGYDHLLMVRDGTLTERIGTRANIIDKESNLAYSRYLSWMPSEMREMLQKPSKGDDPVLCLAVKTEGALLNNGASLYSIYYDWFQTMGVLLVIGVMLVVSLLMLLGVAIKHKSLAIACAGIARVSGKLWLECKVIVLVCAAGFGMTALDYLMWQGLGTIEAPLAILFVFWLLWPLCNDLRYNGKTLWKHNSVSTLLRFLHSLESKHAFCARLKRRLLVLICAELALAFVALMLALIFEGFGVFLDLFVVGLGIFLLIHYIYSYNKGIDQLSTVVDYTRQVRNGSAEQPLVLPKDSDYCEMAADLNDIHSGMAKMVDARLKSEQMKAELITNVSHDLKTPLTSIINYVDLLSKEELSPAYANDYVGVLAKKSDRLKTLVQDLFEISKAQSGAIDFSPEKLNVVALLEQTVAEMDARSGQNNTDIRFQFVQPHVLVCADGKKLHRVFENLLGNALKYSLAGTRIYVTMQSNGQHVQIVFKNVAGYEMAFTEQEIVERFQRGDTARTSDGSGLGLAIAKSFLELNSGNLRVELDGDMFKAIVTLPVFQPDAPHPPTPVPPTPASTMHAPIPPAGVPAAPMPAASGGVGHHPIAEQQVKPMESTTVNEQATSVPAESTTVNEQATSAPMEDQLAYDETIPVFAQTPQTLPAESAELTTESSPLQAQEEPALQDALATVSKLNPPAWVLNAPASVEIATASAEELSTPEAFEEIAVQESAEQQENNLPYEVAAPFKPADTQE